MPDIPLSPEDQKALSETGGDITVNAPPAERLSAPVQTGIDFTKGQFIGDVKGAASLIPERYAPKSWSEYAKSPSQGGAEGVGEALGYQGTRIAPAFLVSPAVKGFNALTKMITGIQPSFTETLGSTAMRAFGAGSPAYRGAISGIKAVARTAEGAMGGGLEAGIQNENEQDPWKFGRAVATGTIEGGISSGAFNMGRMGYELLPPAWKKGVASGALGLTVTGGGLLLWDTATHHHYIPWHALYMAASPLLGMAKGISRVPPAVVGATYQNLAHGGARSPSPESQDRIAPEQ